MEIKIIDEKNGNPFEYFPRDGYKPDYPRNYEKQKNVQKVISGLLTKIELDKNIECLEIGAGHNPKPSQALSNLVEKVITLDADWEPQRHTDFSELENYKKLKAKWGKELVIPRLAGKNDNVDCYLGDMAFLKHEKSELKNKKFDLIYFWGSLYSTGICSSIDCSVTAEELGISINFSERLLPALSNLKNNGKILSIGPHFNGHDSETKKDVGIYNINLVETALFYALGSERKAKSIEIFVQTPESVKKRLRIKNFLIKTQERLLDDPFERKIRNGWGSLFGEDNDYENLRNTLNRLDNNKREKLKNLGLVDAVSIEY